MVSRVRSGVKGPPHLNTASAACKAILYRNLKINHNNYATTTIAIPLLTCYTITTMAATGQRMANTVELLTLRRPTKYNTRLTVPSTYVHAHNLRDGDRVLWIPQPDGVLLKFSPSLIVAPAPSQLRTEVSHDRTQQIRHSPNSL